MLCPRCGDKLTPFSADADPEGDPPPGIGEAEWLDKKDWAAAKAEGRQLLDALDYVLLHLEGILVRQLHEFLTYEDLSQRLGDHRKTRIKAIAQSAEEANALRGMLKALLAERTPITEFDVLCDVFLESADRDSPVVITRMRMVPGVRRQLWGNSCAFTLLETGPRFEQLIAGRSWPRGSGRCWPSSPTKRACNRCRAEGSAGHRAACLGRQ